MRSDDKRDSRYNFRAALGQDMPGPLGYLAKFCKDQFEKPESPAALAAAPASEGQSENNPREPTGGISPPCGQPNLFEREGV